MRKLRRRMDLSDREYAAEMPGWNDGWMYEEPEEVEEWDSDYERRTQDWEDYLEECRQLDEERDRELEEKERTLIGMEEHYSVYDEGHTDEGCKENKAPQPTTDDEEDFGTPYTHNEGPNHYTTPFPMTLDSYEAKQLFAILLMRATEPSRGKIHTRVHTHTKREQASRPPKPKPPDQTQRRGHPWAKRSRPPLPADDVWCRHLRKPPDKGHIQIPYTPTPPRSDDIHHRRPRRKPPDHQHHCLHVLSHQKNAKRRLARKFQLKGLSS
jgi:hypothetical protein